MALFTASKTIKLSTGHSYCYLYHQARAQSRVLPTLLFLHGFPSSAYDFRYQVNHFAPKGYGVLVPDLLGYGGTSQPLDVQKYSMSKMAREIIEILDHEGIPSVVGISHDWGSALLSTLLRQHHQRFDAFVFMATYYGAAHPYSSDSVYDYGKLKQMSLEKFGFNAFGHTMFLGDSARAGSCWMTISKASTILSGPRTRSCGSRTSDEKVGLRSGSRRGSEETSPAGRKGRGAEEDH